MRLTARRVAREALRRALAVEIAHAGIDRSALELAVPGALLREIRHLARGMSRDDCLIMVGHLAMLVRIFAAEVPIARRDQMLAELDDFERGLDQLAGA